MHCSSNLLQLGLLSRNLLKIDIRECQQINVCSGDINLFVVTSTQNEFSL